MVFINIRSSLTESPWAVAMGFGFIMLALGLAAGVTDLIAILKNVNVPGQFCFLYYWELSASFSLLANSFSLI
jgi:hypothetical protein